MHESCHLRVRLSQRATERPAKLMFRFKTLATLIATTAVALVATGCVVRTRPAYYASDYEYVAPPAYVEQQTPIYYGGAPTYYYEGRWYRRTPQGWGYYRNEPYELQRRRPTTYSAPPAYRSAPPAYSAPPARRSAPPAGTGRIEAPPAYRR